MIVLPGCSLFGGDIEIKSYSINGYVYIDGIATAGADINCGGVIVTSDENGYYECAGLDRAVQVTISKSGVYFDDNLVYVYSDTTDVNFNGYTIFEVGGITKNGMQVVPFARVKVNSVLGEYETVSNEFGVFYLPRLAGTVEITAIKEGINFFTQTFDKTATEVVVNSQTRITGRIETDGQISIDDFALMLNDVECEIGEDGTFVLTGVDLGSNVTLLSAVYYVVDSSREIVTVNDYIIFRCYQYYNVTGRVVSGETLLDTAEIMVGDRIVGNNNGEFEITDLYGEREILVSLHGFVFNSVVVNKDNCNIVVNGTFAINGILYFDVPGSAIVYVDDIAMEMFGDNFTCSNAHIGSIIRVEADGYYIDGDLQISGLENVIIRLYKLYDLDIAITNDDFGLIAVLDDEMIDVVEGHIVLNDLYGEHQLQVNQDGYYYDDININSENNQLSITGEKIYNLNLTVVSGDIILDNAVISIDDVDYDVDENGCLVINEVHNSGMATIVCDGYNSQEINFDCDNNTQTISLDYDISGTIALAGKNVSGVVITVLEISVTTGKNGNFEITHLYGVNTLHFTKDYYNFADVEVDHNTSLNITGTYSVSGTLSNDLGGISNMRVYLLNTDTMELANALTNEYGQYSFSELNGEYMLYYDDSIGITLKPNCYEISTGGVFNFSDTGYAFSGRITCGGIGVEDVMLVAGESRAYTDAQGYYRFDLIVSDAILSISKTGYIFTGNGLAVDATYDGRDDVDFTCTYSISGYVSMGGNAMSGVEISTQGQSTTTDEFGYYYFAGLVGNGEISISREGYLFDGITEYDSHCVLNFSAYFTQELHVVSGNLNIAGVEILCGSITATTDIQGMVTLNHVTTGDIVTFSKDGYVISSIVLGDISDTIVVPATYTLNGIVTSIGPISNVTVWYGDNNVITDAQGRFVITNISGSITLTFDKSGFDFDSITINGETSITATARYSVTGYVKVGDHALSDVSVSTGSAIVVTDAQGYFEFTGLNTGVNITFNKTGYTFTPSSVSVNSPQNLSISAYYSVSGIVTSGNIVIDGVKVTLSNGDYVYTNNDGYYCFNSVSDIVDITFEKNGYDTQIIGNVSGYRNDCNVNMSYSIQINFSGISDYTGLSVGVNGVNNSVSTSPYSIGNLTGENTITFAKTDYQFSPSSYVVSGYVSINVTASMVYSVSGTFKTTSGIAIPNATITAGALSTTTDANGAYLITGLNTSAKLSASIVTTSNTLSASETNINGTCTHNFTVSDSDYAYFMWARGYDNLRISRYYEIYGKGTVVAHPPLVGDQTQQVTVIYKKDLNYRIFKNQNYGSETMGVDPKVAVLVSIDLQNGQDSTFRYQRKTGSAVSTSTASFDTNWSTDKTKASFLSDNGIDLDNFYPYTINKNTIKSITNFAKTTAGYKFKMTLDHSKAETTANYKKQMYYMCSDQSCDSFSKIELMYEIYDNGFIKQMDITESYTVKAKGFSVSTDGNISYYFYTTYMDQSFTAMDMSSTNGIANSIAMPTLPTTKISYIKPTDVYIYDDRRYVL